MIEVPKGRRKSIIEVPKIRKQSLNDGQRYRKQSIVELSEELNSFERSEISLALECVELLVIVFYIYFLIVTLFCI